MKVPFLSRNESCIWKNPSVASINTHIYIILHSTYEYSMNKRYQMVAPTGSFFAEQWSDQYLKEMNRRDWTIPKIVISDRDRKFLSHSWRNWFFKLDVFMLYSTTYHSTDTRWVRAYESDSGNRILLLHSRAARPDSIILALWTFQAVVNNTHFALTEKNSQWTCVRSNI
jgi:hypothetical protein